MVYSRYAACGMAGDTLAALCAASLLSVWCLDCPQRSGQQQHDWHPASGVERAELTQDCVSGTQLPTALPESCFSAVIHFSWKGGDGLACTQTA
jgi:hypothetical protein